MLDGDGVVLRVETKNDSLGKLSLISPLRSAAASATRSKSSPRTASATLCGSICTPTSRFFDRFISCSLPASAASRLLIFQARVSNSSHGSPPVPASGLPRPLSPRGSAPASRGRSNQRHALNPSDSPCAALMNTRGGGLKKRLRGLPRPLAGSSGCYAGFLSIAQGLSGGSGQRGVFRNDCSRLLR